MARKKKSARKTAKKKTAKKKATKAKTRGARRGKRYSDKAKSKLLARYQDLKESGTPALDAAKKLGVSYVTLLSWEKKAGKKPRVGRPSKKSARKQLEKAVAPPRRKKPETGGPLAGGLTLVTPKGYRIEGISTKDLIAVLRALK